MGTDSGAPSSYPSTFTENGEKACTRPVKAFDQLSHIYCCQGGAESSRKKKKKSQSLKPRKTRDLENQ